MKTQYFVFIIAVSYFFVSCSNKRKSEPIPEKQHCLPGYVCITYAGITDKIRKFTLIPTSENDSSFFQSQYRTEIGFVGDDLFFDNYCNNYITDQMQFFQLKKYILSQNTQKKDELSNIDNYNAVLIALVDQCDSVEYIVNEGDKKYFSNMIDSLKIREQPFLEYLNYYGNIIESDRTRKN